MEILTEQQTDRVSYLTEACPSLSEFKETLNSVESLHELHQVATRLNWDYGLNWFLPLIKHPLCDYGTILELYWYGQPDYFVGYKSFREVKKRSLSNSETYQLLKEIESVQQDKSHDHSQIEYRPMEKHSIGVRRCLAKYSDIPDNLLIQTCGDTQANLRALSELRKEPDDLEDPDTLRFLAQTYCPNAGKHVEAMEYASKLMSVEPEKYIYRSVKNRCFRTTMDLMKSGVAVDLEINSFREDYISFLREEVQILKKLIADDTLPSFRRFHLEEVSHQLATLLGDQGLFGEAVIVLEELLKSDYGRRKDYIRLELAKMYASIPKAGEALAMIDEFLQGKKPNTPPYTHKYQVLKTLDKHDDADALLAEMIQHTSSEIESSIRDGTVHAGHFREKSRLLYQFQGDYPEAAETLRHVIEKELYGDEQNKMKVVGEIKALEHQLAPNAFLNMALGAIETNNFDQIENLRDDIDQQHIPDLMSTWSADLPWEIKDGYIHLLLDQTGELTAPVMIDGLGSPMPENRASALVILSKRELEYDDLMMNEKALAHAIEEWKSKTDC